MMTKVVAEVAEAVELLKGGQVVAIPTETVYGLAANALSAAACQRIYEAKQRPSDNPLIVHISALSQLEQVIEQTLFADAFRKSDGPADPLVQRLRAVSERFWPGPLTVIVPKNLAVPDIVCGGGHLDTVAVRFPAHPVAQRIIDLCGFPLAAPSANLSGRPSPTTAAHVLEDLQGRIPLVVDAGRSSFGVESTVLDITQPLPTILRPGSITLRQLQEVFPDCQLYEAGSSSSLESRPPTPGLKYRHYSPNTPVVLCPDRASADAFCAAHSGAARLTYGRGQNDGRTYHLAPTNTDYATIASNLFAALRDADTARPSFIVAEACAEVDEGMAVMNRLSKAAHQILSPQPE